MIEGTPGQPYGGTMSEFNTVEDNMRQRRQEATSLLKENQALCTITSFPRLVPTWTCPRGHFRAQGYKEQILTKHLTLPFSYLIDRSFFRPAFGSLYVRATGRRCTLAPVGGGSLENCKGCVWAWWERPGGHCGWVAGSSQAGWRQQHILCHAARTLWGIVSPLIKCSLRPHMCLPTSKGWHWWLSEVTCWRATISAPRALLALNKGWRGH